MGRGNYCPSGECSSQWYIDHDNYLWDDFEHESWEIDYELLGYDIDDVMIAVQKRFPSFHPIDEWGSNYWAEHFLLENKFFRIGRADNEWSEAVFIQMKDDLWPEQESLASQHFATYCDGIRAIILDKLGELYLRTGPWTSARIKQGMEVSA